MITETVTAAPPSSSTPRENGVDVAPKPVSVVTVTLRIDEQGDVTQPEQQDGSRWRHTAEPCVQLPGRDADGVRRRVLVQQPHDDLAELTPAAGAFGEQRQVQQVLQRELTRAGPVPVHDP